MHQLKELIRESRNWATVDRGLTLFSKVSSVLQNTFAVDAGMIVYRKQFLPRGNESRAKIYEPWGVNCSASELTKMIIGGAWFTGESCDVPERWLPVTEGPPVWRKVWTEVGVKYVGAWKLTVQNQCVGAIVVGRKTAPDENNEELMSVLATYVSLVGEMLMLRRVAEHDSHFDGLTHIYNRRGLIAQIKQLSGKQDEVFMIGVLDIDDFKGINDTYGHSKGDSVLVEVAGILSKNIGSDGVYGRSGGDEFVFVLKDHHGPVDDLGLSVSDWFNGKPFTVSIGLALWEPHKTDWESSLKVADQRLYEQKRRLIRIIP